jgi:hypothetical protein
MENIHENQVGEVLSYQYEPGVGEKQAIFKFWDRYKYRTSIHASWTFGLWFTYNHLSNGFLLFSTVY